MRTYTNCRIFTGDEFIGGKNIIIDNGRISCISDEMRGDAVDLCGRIVCAGFLDIQVNGGGGVLFNETPTREGINAIYAAHRAFGTASICPTFITDSTEKLQHAANAVSECSRLRIPAIHIEGFFVSPKKRGIHSRENILEPTQDNVHRIADFGTCRKILTIAPEVFGDDIDSVMKILEICTVFGGHSDSTYNQFASFLSAGGRGATHLYNAMSGISGREPGVIGAVLDKGAYAGIIVDGHHVDYACVRIAKKTLGEKLFLVSDAMPPACSSISEYMLYGERVFVKNGVCVSDKGVIAGSCICMMQAVKNCVEKCSIDLAEALRMATLYPANAIGCTDMGRIEKGYPALFTVFDEKLQNAEVYEN